MAKIKYRVRICLKDIYRYIAIGKTVEILGIREWSATAHGIRVTFENGRRKFYRAGNEDDRKQAIKIINKYISEVH